MLHDSIKLVRKENVGDTEFLTWQKVEKERKKGTKYHLKSFYELHLTTKIG